MIKYLKASKDTYITNKLISDVRQTRANVGGAATLDLYKLYGINEISGSAATELSRILIKFDLSDLQNLYNENYFDVTNTLFNAQLKLFDVYGGQPTPSNYTITIYPLSRSFDEGIGRDIIQYSDYDSCNFLSSSYNVLWGTSGAYNSGSAPNSCDYFTMLSNGTSLLCSQTFVEGTENLQIDITSIISATLTSQIPNEGLLITYSQNIENDDKTYFVKRFASRTAYNEDYHPRLIIRYNDAIQDDVQNLEFNCNNTINLYNYQHMTISNICSASTEIVGNNCCLFKLMTPISGGNFINYFTASQAKIGNHFLTGVYTVNVNLTATGTLKQNLITSGSVDFDGTWLSFDKSVEYAVDKFTFTMPYAASTKLDFSQYTVTATGIKESHKLSEKVMIRVNVFDYKSPLIKGVLIFQA